MSVLHITNAVDFEKEVLEAKEPVLVDFWATWCGPCRMLGPVIEDLATSADGYKVAKVDIDEAEELAVRYDIQVVPSLLFFRAGKVAKRLVGVRPKSELLAAILALK